MFQYISSEMILCDTELLFKEILQLLILVTKEFHSKNRTRETVLKCTYKLRFRKILIKKYINF